MKIILVSFSFFITLILQSALISKPNVTTSCMHCTQDSDCATSQCGAILAMFLVMIMGVVKIPLGRARRNKNDKCLIKLIFYGFLTPSLLVVNTCIYVHNNNDQKGKMIKYMDTNLKNQEKISCVFNYNRFIPLMMKGAQKMRIMYMLIIICCFSFPVFSEGYTGPYCCCSDNQCISGDHHSCCTTSYHPYPRAQFYGDCEGIVPSGAFGDDPNPCGHVLSRNQTPLANY